MRAQALARGLSDTAIANLEAAVGPERLPDYLRDLLDGSTLRGRLRRGGLLSGDHEDED